MARLFFFLFFMVACFFSTAQSAGPFYVFKKDWTPAKNFEQAIYFMQQTKETDSLYVCRYYRKTGPMVKWESYKDSSLEIPNGIFAWYNEKGTMDSTGWVVNGRKNETWSYGIGDSGKVKMTEYFENGRMMKRVNYVTRRVTYNNGESEPLDKPKPVDTVTINTKTFTVVQVPAEFEGGIKGWTNYLMKNIVTPDRFTNISKAGTKATVGVTFYVEKDGSIGNVFIEKSYEWSVDTESIRVIKNAPHWKPAMQNGKNVVYRHKQSLTYSVSVE